MSEERVQESVESFSRKVLELAGEHSESRSDLEALQAVVLGTQERIREAFHAAQVHLESRIATAEARALLPRRGSDRCR